MERGINQASSGNKETGGRNEEIYKGSVVLWAIAVPYIRCSSMLGDMTSTARQRQSFPLISLISSGELTSHPLNLASDHNLLNANNKSARYIPIAGFDHSKLLYSLHSYITNYFL